MWIAVGHFLQYLWFTSYFAVPGAPLAGKLGYLGKGLLAGSALWVLPTLLFGPRLLGSMPYDVGLAVMGAAMVNLHHFILDGLIWKTSSGGRLRRLLADPPASAPLGGAPLRRLAPAVWAAGAVCAAVYLAGYWEAEFGVRRALARGDVSRFRAAIERSAWIGRESPRHHVGLAKLAQQAGDTEGARRAIERSLALYPTPAGWAALGEWHEKASQWREARDAYAKAVELDPSDAQALYSLALVWLRLDEPARAREALQRAAALVPDNRLVQLSLQRAEAQLERSAGLAAAAERKPPDRAPKEPAARASAIR
jgi:tetratricopeptide (TPR) repeat protein